VGVGPDCAASLEVAGRVRLAAPRAGAGADPPAASLLSAEEAPWTAGALLTGKGGAGAGRGMGGGRLVLRSSRMTCRGMNTSRSTKPSSFQPKSPQSRSDAMTTAVGTGEPPAGRAARRGGMDAVIGQWEMAPPPLAATTGRRELTQTSPGQLPPLSHLPRAAGAVGAVEEAPCRRTVTDAPL